MTTTQNDLNTTLYHAIQVIYRRSVIRHIRAAFTVQYGDAAAERLRTKYFGGGRWDENLAKASASLAAGVIRTEATDDFDRIDVSSFASILDGDRRVLLPKREGESDAEWKARANGVVKQAELVTAARNPNAHPTSTDLSWDDFNYAIQNAARVVAHFDLEAELELISAGRQELLAKRSPESYLPPSDEIGATFVGRDAELARLWVWMKDADARRWLLMGAGGRGKTAIAYEFARQVREAGAPGIELIVWLSAKARAFVDGQVRERSPHFVDLQSAVNYVLATTGIADESATEDEDRRRLVKELFSQMPALIVVDDVDSLDESQDDAIEFFTDIAYRSRSKLLMTSRRSLLGLGLFSTVVQGLNAADAEAFINSRADLYCLNMELLTKKRRQRIVEVTESSPLYMEDLLRLVATGANVDQSIASWREHGGEAARRFALGRELDMLGPVAREVLVAAAIPTSPVSIAELRRTSSRPTDDVEGALTELRRLFLVPNPQMIDEVERFSLQANTRSLVLDWARRELPDATSRIRERWKAIARSSTGGRDAPSVSLVRRAEALLADGELAESERVLEAGLSEYPEDAGLHAQLGRLYARWSPPRISDARQHFRRALDLGGSDPTLFRDWISMEVRAGEISLAVDTGREGMRRHGNDPELRLRLGHAEWTLGRMQKDHASRMELFDAASRSIFPLMGSGPPPVEPQHREQALFLQAYVTADQIAAIDAHEAARAAYGRNPERVVAQREASTERPRASEQHRIRLRQALNRLAQEFPSDRQLDAVARLRHLTKEAPPKKPYRRHH